MTAIVDGDGRLLGLYTDGDLRRTLADPAIDVHRARIADVMTRSPVAIEADALASEAARLMEDRKITMLPVVDDERRVIGALNIHDLLRARVRSEEHTSELQSLMRISYAVFSLQKKNKHKYSMIMNTLH